jgi:hypothetical protein
LTDSNRPISNHVMFLLDYKEKQVFNGQNILPEVCL